MSLIITGDRITLTDPADGRVALDSDAPMFFALGGLISGTEVIPARSNVDTSVSIDRNVTLASCHASANAVLGWMRITGSGQGQIPEGVWAPVGGTYVNLMAMGVGISGDFRFTQTTSGLLTHMQAFSIYAAGGFVIMNEQTLQMRINTADVSAGDLTGLESFTIHYRLYAGTFDA